MSSQPGWLERLTGCVCDSLTSIGEPTPIGCHYQLVDDTWEIAVFFSPTEIVGGEFDGHRIEALFLVNVLELAHVFDVVEQIFWQPMPVDDNDEIGANLSMTGYFDGKRVLLRVLAATPSQFESGRFANLHEKRLIDTWTAE